MTTGKVCKRCGIKKDPTDFYEYRWVCKACCVRSAAQRQERHKVSHRKDSAAYYRRNRERCLTYSKNHKKANWDKVLVSARASNRKRRLKAMGASPADFLAALETQNGRCAICLVEVSADGGKNVHIDHCHKTGRFRGILCAHCNKGLGHFRDEPEVLSRAASYLLRTVNDQAPRILPCVAWGMDHGSQARLQRAMLRLRARPQNELQGRRQRPHPHPDLP